METTKIVFDVIYTYGPFHYKTPPMFICLFYF